MGIKITAHTIVKNEERFIWYSVMSVIDFVNEYIIWDMGSRDKTYEILKELCFDPRTKGKIKLKRFEPGWHFDEKKFRQEILNATSSDWFIVVDGDEIWWRDSIEKVASAIKEKGGKLESIVTPTLNVIGDMYHYQPEDAGHYRLAGMVGHLALRAVNTKIPGLHSAKGHGLWGWVDKSGKMIQDRDEQKIRFIDAPYIHTTHLQRSSSLAMDKDVFKRAFKLKHEIGISFPNDFFYPEVFFMEKPEYLDTVWKPMNFGFWLRSVIETPLRKLKRKMRLFKEGY